MGKSFVKGNFISQENKQTNFILLLKSVATHSSSRFHGGHSFARLCHVPRRPPSRGTLRKMRCVCVGGVRHVY